VRIEANTIRLFAIDVDGTLLDGSHRLTTEVKDAVCRLAASGLEIALATARGPQAVHEIVQQFNFAPWLICFSGGWIGELELLSLQPKSVRLDLRIPNSAAGIGAGDLPVLAHGPTFMGNPLACAVANASLDVLLGDQAQAKAQATSAASASYPDGWRAEVRRIEAGLRAGLAPAAGLPGVADVRVLGAIGVVQLDHEVDIPAATAAAVRAGVWLRPFRDLVYTMPPYVTGDEDVAVICAGVLAAVEPARNSG
jgi:hypothetical protein